MPTYKIDWTTENWHRMTVEADTPEEAQQIWLESGVVFSDDFVYDGDYIQEDSVEIEEVE